MRFVAYIVKARAPYESARESRIYATGDAVYNSWTSRSAEAFRFTPRDADRTIEDARDWAKLHMEALRLNLRVPEGKKLALVRVVAYRKGELR